MLKRKDIHREEPYNVLFLCTGNSARSIMAEVLLNRAGQGKFRAFSAGSQPKGEVHPYALDLLTHLHYDVTGLRSKSWKEFSSPDAPKLASPRTAAASPRTAPAIARPKALPRAPAETVTTSFRRRSQTLHLLPRVPRRPG